MLFELMLKPIDTYWKKQFRAEEIRRRRAEVDAKYADDMRKYQEEDLALLSERDRKQALAIEAMNRELDRLRKLTEQQEAEIRMLRECLQSERTANAALKTNARLWEQIKREAAS